MFSVGREIVHWDQMGESEITKSGWSLNLAVDIS